MSATPGVIIFGPTPNNLLQDKLGEYRRVQLRVITDRGVYEMAGAPSRATKPATRPRRPAGARRPPVALRHAARPRGAQACPT